MLYELSVGNMKADLPEFDAPPLNEVVLGIQFQPPANYQQIQAFQVWDLFRQEFPLVREHPPLPPQFETFGLPAFPQLAFNFSGGPVHDRFWFTKNGERQLIQFQQDRLLHNWRKVDPEQSDYPRFENIISQFEREISKLEEYFVSLGNARLVVTQCELSYINHILLPEGDEPFAPQKWLAYIEETQAAIDEMMSVVKKVLRDASGKPYGRFYRESGTGTDRFGRKILFLNFTVRGLPPSDSVGDALAFINAHRQMIAEEFIKSTTAAAQKIWERTR
jgi:uncharacterized protein (TIGR04255 family)